MSDKVQTKAQEPKAPEPQKPISIESYIKALQKEFDVSRLRAGIAENMFKERMAMLQMRQMEAGLNAPPPDPSPISALTNQEHGEQPEEVQGSLVAQ